MNRLQGLLRRGSEDRPTEKSRPAPERSRREPGEPLRVAALTFCRDEGRMLPLWISYYGSQLGVDNLYVVDDNSEDGSTDDLPCDVLHIPPIRGGKFNSTRMAMVGNLGRSLLQLYDDQLQPTEAVGKLKKAAREMQQEYERQLVV